jgi:hypothetical protein
MCPQYILRQLQLYMCICYLNNCNYMRIQQRYLVAMKVSMRGHREYSKELYERNFNLESFF